MVEPPDALKPPIQEHDGSNRTSDVHPRTAGSGPSAQARASTAGSPGPRRAQQPIGRRGGELIIGRLKGHGPAPYQFRPKQDLSYYAKVETNRGMRVLWGKDLARAILEGETKPKFDDLIGARRRSREAVTVVNRTRDAHGNVLTQSEHHAHRTRWEVEKLQFFSERAKRARLARDAHLDTRDAVRKRPELRSTFLSLRAAEELAARRIANPQDRERFLAMVREAITGSVRRGEPLPDLGLRKKTRSDPAPSPSPQPKRDREEPTR